MKILLGVTGSVAAIKIPQLYSELSKIHQVIIVCTKPAMHFLTNLSEFESLLKSHPDIKIYEDEDEWKWNKIGDDILHITLRSWADLLLIAPLDANTLAKLNAGICDNLLTCIVRAWDNEKTIVLCPAMNTLMWSNKLTAMHLENVSNIYNVKVIAPISKVLACGDEGVGAMANVPFIVEQINKY